VEDLPHHEVPRIRCLQIVHLAFSDTSTRLLVRRSEVRVRSGLGVQKDSCGLVGFLGGLFVADHVSVLVHVVDLNRLV